MGCVWACFNQPSREDVALRFHSFHQQLLLLVNPHVAVHLSNSPVTDVMFELLWIEVVVRQSAASPDIALPIAVDPPSQVPFRCY